MRIALLTLGSRGDVQPLVALGRGLQAAGHDVVLATHPRFEAFVADLGLRFAPLAEGHVSRGAETAEGQRWIDSQRRGLAPAWLGFLRDARSVAARRLADAAAACQDAEAIVAANLAFVLGWQMADLRGVPLVRAYVEPPAWMLAGRPVRPVAPAVRQVAWLAARPWLHRVRRGALGLGPLPLREPLADLDRRGMPVLYAFSPEVLPVPGGLGGGSEVTGYWFVDDGLDPDPPAELVEFLDAGPPPVSIGFSTMIGSDPAATAELVREAVAEAEVRAVVIGPGERLAQSFSGAGIMAVGAVSHDWLFPRCAAVVHHAAVGTTAAGLRAGVPAVGIPHMTDQFLWARRLHELGVAPAPSPRRDLTASRLAQAIRAAVGDGALRRAARALGERIAAEDGVGRAVQAIQQRVGGRALTSSPAP
jgi:sterol 3beta-glucosyltransferase